MPRSLERNADSPWSWKMIGMVAPQCRSISRSESATDHPRRSARLRATLVFPVPLKPISTIRSMLPTFSSRLASVSADDQYSQRSGDYWLVDGEVEARWEPRNTFSRSIRVRPPAGPWSSTNSRASARLPGSQRPSSTPNPAGSTRMPLRFGPQHSRPLAQLSIKRKYPDATSLASAS